MKLRLTQPGYENFTGLLGSMTFTNGTSDLEVSVETAAGMANIVRCERIDASVDTGQMDTTDTAVVVHDTAGDVDAATEPAPVDADNIDTPIV